MPSRARNCPALPRLLDCRACSRPVSSRSTTRNRRRLGLACRHCAPNWPSGAKLGSDPWLHTAEGAERLGRACANAGATLIAAEPNPIDTIWLDRPAPPLGPVVLHDLRFAGEAANAKLDNIRAEIGS